MASSNNPSPEGAAGTAIERRKAEHLRIAAEEDIETNRAPGWDDVHLVHDLLRDEEGALAEEWRDVAQHVRDNAAVRQVERP
jgi:hypothetical protein